METLLSWDLVSVVIMLFLVCTESAADTTKYQKNKSASLGEIVTLVCNNSEMDASYIWKKDTVLIFSHSDTLNKTERRFTSDRMSVDPPTKLTIFNVELHDTGSYRCQITDDQSGVRTMEWNLTITKNLTDHAEHGLRRLLLFTIPSAIGGVVLCINICCMVWLCRKRKQEQTSHCDRHREVQQECNEEVIYENCLATDAAQHCQHGPTTLREKEAD
ncbi:uncharacterized protein LOC115161170 isoform X1 [Salmo trutta]|uniref:uncharacterized protein LOC115161170 isoform X1 n=1 Tax=Salmo trutta TaxID=8032 RepID=UPI0011323FDD|nr:uncharacterized protein LOC115161170 isoform X1 [Salmo trutta]XP_029567812.1 uncharacterized protein LOC115161170 isoform X1 [Salmo trutta]